MNIRKNHGKTIRRTVTALILAGALTVPMTAFAAPAYESNYTETSSMAQLLMPALMKNTDPTGVALQLSTALRYGSITQGDIWNMIQEGCTIPAESLRLLYEQGQVSGYLYKTASGLPYEPSDFAGVYDEKDYVSLNPAIAKALSDGSLQEQDLFYNFLLVGMPNGLAGSKEFSPAVFSEKYPEIAEELGNNVSSYYVWYLIYGKDKGMDCSAQR